MSENDGLALAPCSCFFLSSAFRRLSLYFSSSLSSSFSSCSSSSSSLLFFFFALLLFVFFSLFVFFFFFFVLSKSKTRLVQQAELGDEQVPVAAAAPKPPKTVRTWVDSAFAITLFAMDEEHETRSLDLLYEAFRQFPLRDYCIITIPASVAEFPLLQNFTHMTPKPDAIVPHELYVLHRHALIRLIIRTRIEWKKKNGMDEGRKKGRQRYGMGGVRAMRFGMMTHLPVFSPQPVCFFLFLSFSAICRCAGLPVRMCLLWSACWQAWKRPSSSRRTWTGFFPQAKTPVCLLFALEPPNLASYLCMHLQMARASTLTLFCASTKLSAWSSGAMPGLVGCCTEYK